MRSLFSAKSVELAVDRRLIDAVTLPLHGTQPRRMKPTSDRDHETNLEVGDVMCKGTRVRASAEQGRAGQRALELGTAVSLE